MQAALSDACSATVEDLFPRQENVTSIRGALNRTDPALSTLIPSPFVGFTLILAGNQAFANANSAPCELLANILSLPCQTWSFSLLVLRCAALTLVLQG